MRKISRRDFIRTCSSGISLSVLAQVNPAYGQSIPFSFWTAPSAPPEVRTTQLLCKAAAMDTSFKVYTTQLITKTAAIDRSYNVRTTQFLVKVAAKP
jgi:hypothetical protein